MKPRILFIVNVDWFFVSHRLPIALAAIAQGYEVHLATKVTDRRAELERQGLIVHDLDLERGRSSVRGLVAGFRRILKLYGTIEPDLVHLVTIKPVLLGGLAARFAAVPAVVAAISGLGVVFVARGATASVRRHLVRLLYRLALRHPNIKVIFQNPTDRALLSGLARLGDGGSEMIRGSGVDLSRYTPRPLDGPPVVMLAGRLLYDKGVGEFVDAARLLMDEERIRSGKTRFVLVGAPDPENPASVTEQALREWEDEGIIEHWGHRDDMPDVLARAHIVALPSYYGEGLPKILIEAAACGRAVVTSDHPGCRDAVEPGVTGLLVPVRDAGALAAAFRQLLDDPRRLDAMGQAGRSFAEKVFDIRDVVDRHLRIYRELLKKSANGRINPPLSG